MKDRYLTQWGRVTHIYVSQLTIIDSDNGLSPDRRPAIIWTIDELLLFGPLEKNFCEIEIYTFSIKKMHSKMSSGEWRPSFLGFSVLNERCNFRWFVMLYLVIQLFNQLRELYFFVIRDWYLTIFYHSIIVAFSIRNICTMTQYFHRGEANTGGIPIQDGSTWGNISYIY